MLCIEFSATTLTPRKWSSRARVTTHETSQCSGKIDAGNVIETHEHKGRFQRVVKRACTRATVQFLHRASAMLAISRLTNSGAPKYWTDSKDEQ
jgi:hypothetical protein